jgi:hypothetical protein
MKRRNWLLIVLCVAGVAGFILSRTVWGPPAKATASEGHSSQAIHDGAQEPETMSDAERRYLSNQPRHWRYVMLKTR